MASILDKHLTRTREAIAKRGLTLGPPLSEAEVTHFEKQTGCALPDDYRRFVIEIGNGGDGPPEYGLMPLGGVPDDFPTSAKQITAALSRPFPLTAPHVPDPDADDGPKPLGMLDGALHLGTDGCGSYWLLVVSGKQRGKVWNMYQGGYAPCDPPKGFLRWYQAWLDDEEWDLCAEPEPPPVAVDSVQGQRQALGDAMRLLDEGKANEALALLDVLHHDGVATHKRFVQARARVKLGGPMAIDAAREMVREWLGPAVVGSVNQIIERAEMLALLEDLEHPDAAEMSRQIREAPAPDIAVQLGDDVF